MNPKRETPVPQTTHFCHSERSEESLSAGCSRPFAALRVTSTTTRRDFLKTTAVAGTALAANMSLLGNVFEDRLKGCQSWLKKFAGEDELVKKNGNSVDLPDERCHLGFNAYQNVLNSGVDYVILATPPGFRPIHLEAAVAAGKHIFTEKPVGTDGPGISKVLAACQEANKKNLRIVAGTQRRHQAAYLETLQQIHDGAIG